MFNLPPGVGLAADWVAKINGAEALRLRVNTADTPYSTGLIHGAVATFESAMPGTVVEWSQENLAIEPVSYYAP
jgi:hypothetical protein